MFILNFKLSKKSISKFILALMFIICIILTFLCLSIIFKKSQDNKYFTDIDCNIPQNEIAEILPENYTNILKEVHENVDTYVGQKISFTGYVYRLSNFLDDQFVLARDMDIGNNQTLIVGFLCSCDKINNFQTNSWIKVTGEITKGIYEETSVPILKILSVEEAVKPDNCTVPLPDDSYVPTAVIY